MRIFDHQMCFLNLSIKFKAYIDFIAKACLEIFFSNLQEDNLFQMDIKFQWTLINL